MKFTACIFDLDGVIVDTAKYHYQAWRRLAQGFNYDLDERVNESLKGVSRLDSLNTILDLAGVSRSAEEKEKLCALKNGWYLSYIDEMEDDEVLPGVIDFLHALRDRGIKIGLGSASKNAGRILRQLGLSDYFDAIVDGNAVIQGKPHPEVFLRGATALSTPPEKCLVFEDAPKGITAALRAGCVAVGIGRAEVLAEADLVLPGFDGLTVDKLLQMLAHKPVRP